MTFAWQAAKHLAGKSTQSRVSDSRVSEGHVSTGHSEGQVIEAGRKSPGPARETVVAKFSAEPNFEP
jgi:hypothetical protein